MLPYSPTDALTHLNTADHTLGRLIDLVGGFNLQLRHLNTPFETLLRSIVGQQLSVKAAATIFGRVQALFPDTDRLTPEALLAISDDDLRGAGLSRSKLKATRDLARKTLDGTVPATAEALTPLTNVEIAERLTQVWGIGLWTVEMLLIFRLGRPDVLPATDLGIRKGFMRTYGLEAMPAPRAILVHGEAWRPYRSVASWYLWRALDLDDPV